MERAPHPCPWPECRALTTNIGGCPEHRPATKTAERGYGAAWRAFARRYLQRHPRCAKCSKRAIHVDHKVPVRAGGARFDPANCQSLCGPCHVKKTKGENADRVALSYRWE